MGKLVLGKLIKSLLRNEAGDCSSFSYLSRPSIDLIRAPAQAYELADPFPQQSFRVRFPTIATLYEGDQHSEELVLEDLYNALGQANNLSLPLPRKMRGGLRQSFLHSCPAVPRSFQL